MSSPLLEFSKKGIYCAEADVYIDPWKPVPKALITHGHSDHARWGHSYYMCHRLTAPILRHRLDRKLKIREVEYGEQIAINGVQFSFHPAGHILGSSQIRVSYRGEIWVVSGDYKTEDDALCTPLEIVHCHTFITECTFGLPVFRWKSQAEVFVQINSWWRQNSSQGKPSVLYGYSLGKAQRLIKHLDPGIGPIWTHGAVENINEVFRKEGVILPETRQVTQQMRLNDASGMIVVAPPGAFNSTWSKKFKGASHAAASGWMAMRGPRRRKGVDRGFVLSDHADWQGLNDVIEATGAENVIATHGYTNIFVQWLREKGLNAMTEETAFTGENLEETEETIAK